MIRRNIDVIALAVLLAGIAFLSSARNTGILQTVSSRHVTLCERYRSVLVRLSARPPVRYRYY